MRKLKGLLVSASAAAMLLSGSVVMAEDTTEAATEVAAEVTEDIAAVTEEVGADGILASDRDALVTFAESSIQMIVEMTDDQLNELVYPSSVLSVPQASVVTSVQSWQSVKDELGEFVSFREHEISVDDDNITIVSVCEFTNTEGVVTTTLERSTLEMEGITFSTGDQTMGTKMKEAVLNTLMGVVIVFCMLLFLSFLISQFKHISKLENAMKKKKEAPQAPAPAPAPVATPVVPEEELVDDGELVAVIAAAIAAAEGTSADGFVVRSIKKSNRNKWLRA
ncbi:MAG: OadG family protein [Muricoprocola sp.]